MTKEDYIEVFNAMVTGKPVSFQEKLLPMYSEYLTENNIENSEKLINLVVQNPQLIQQYMPEMVSYYCRKYNICSISFNNKILMYYE